MILSTDGLVPMANANNIVTGSTRKFMMMYSGPMPTVEQFEAAMFSNVNNVGFMHSTVRGMYQLNLFNNWAVANGNTLRAWCNYGVAAVAHHIGPTKFRFPLSERPEEFTKVVGGTVDWFVLMTVQSNAANPTSASQVYWMGIGDIGDVGSDADLVLLGRTVDMDRVLKANDLIFNYSWS